MNLIDFTQAIIANYKETSRLPDEAICQEFEQKCKDACQTGRPQEVVKMFGILSKEHLNLLQHLHPYFEHYVVGAATDLYSSVSETTRE